MVRPLHAVEVRPPAEAAPRRAVAPDLRAAGILTLIAAGCTAFWFLPLGIDPKAQHALAMGLVGAFGVGKGSNIARGMFVILVYQATIFDKMLIAGASSITARGAIEKFGQVNVLWSQWFLAYLPCDILVMIIAWRIALWMYPPETATLPGGPTFLESELRAMGRWSAPEIKTALLMSVA